MTIDLDIIQGNIFDDIIKQYYKCMLNKTLT